MRTRWKFISTVLILHFAVAWSNAEIGILSKEENQKVQETCGKKKLRPNFKVACENGHVQCENVRVGQHPWAVSALGICSGTLISPRHVLTAAHCFYKLGSQDDSVPGGRSFNDDCSKGARTSDPDFDKNWKRTKEDTKWMVKVASLDSHQNEPDLEIPIAKATIHPGWCAKPLGEKGTDIAVITLEHEVPSAMFESGAVAYACIPKASETLPADFDLAGYGTDPSTFKVLPFLGSTMPQVGRLLTANLKRMEPGVSNWFRTFETSVRKTDACSGDSGGGLLQKSQGRVKIFGLVSLGPGCHELHNPVYMAQHPTKAHEMATTYSTVITDIRHFKQFVCTHTGVCQGDENEKVTSKKEKVDSSLNDARRLLALSEILRFK